MQLYKGIVIYCALLKLQSDQDDKLELRTKETLLLTVVRVPM